MVRNIQKNIVQPWPLYKVNYGCVFLMMTKLITAIEPQKRDPERVNIYLDGEFAFGLTAILAAWLKVGDSLSDEKIKSLTQDDAFENAFQKALHFISFRPRSTHEVRKNLQDRNIPAPLIDQVITRLQENSLVSDESFARAWVENRSDFRPRSRAVLRMELRQKGVPAEVIESSLTGLNEDQLALSAARRYLHRLENMNQQDFRKKLSAFLSRRGFNFSTIHPVVAQAWQDLHPAGTSGSSHFDEEN